MKKLKLTVAALLLALVSMACAVNCDPDNEKSAAVNDSIVQAALGDSIYGIIKNAKSITAETISYADTSKENISSVKLSADEQIIIKFLLCNPKNVASNDIVYGRFLPNISFKFKHKKRECVLLFDLGLEKWQVKNANDSVLNTFDLKSPEFTRLANRLFPDEKFFIYLLNK